MSGTGTSKRYWQTREFWTDAGERIVTAFVEGVIGLLLVDGLTGPELDLGLGWGIVAGGAAAVLSTVKAIIGSQRSGSTTPVSIT